MRVWLPAVRTGSGADVFVQRLAQGLERAGHEAVVQWFAHGDELHPWTLRNVAAPPSTEIVHAGSWQGFAFARPGIPLVITEHQYIGHPVMRASRRRLQGWYHDLVVRRWVARSYAAASAVVAVSETVAGAFRRDYPQLRVAMIPNWIDAEGFCPRPVAATGHRPFRVLFVGNPSRHKGADFLLPLAHALGDGFELRWLGGLRKAARGGALPANVRLIDPVAPAGMPAVYADTDAVVVLARYESFGYVALEAMACARAVAGFDNTGTAEVCVDGETALLAPTGDVDALADNLRRLAQDPVLRQRMADQGRERALRTFGEARAIDAYCALYRDVAEASRARR